MSDYRAVAGITQALVGKLQPVADAAVPGATMRIGTPGKDILAGAPAMVNILLYQANPNPSFRNAELPVRRADGSCERAPQAALDLHYLFSFYGDELRHRPQLLFGATVAELHARPHLTPEDIPEKIGGKSMSGSGLREQAEIVWFTAIPMNHDELSRLWSVFFQVPYVLSVAYRCSTVLIDSEGTPLPARTIQEESADDEPATIGRA